MRDFFLLPGASAAAMLIFILPSAFYIKLVKKESMKSVQKIGVSTQFSEPAVRLSCSGWTHELNINLFLLSRPLPSSCAAWWSWSAAWASSFWTGPATPHLVQTHIPTDTKAPPLPLQAARGGRADTSSTGLLTTTQPTKIENLLYKKKNTRTHLMLSFDFLSNRPLPFQENVTKLCTVCCYRPQRWCFTCFLLFLLFLFFSLSIFLVFTLFFCV